MKSHRLGINNQNLLELYTITQTCMFLIVLGNHDHYYFKNLLTFLQSGHDVFIVILVLIIGAMACSFGISFYLARGFSTLCQTTFAADEPDGEFFATAFLIFLIISCLQPLYEFLGFPIISHVIMPEIVLAGLALIVLLVRSTGKYGTSLLIGSLSTVTEMVIFNVIGF